ncbi:MAG: FkbM family methyltransferase [Planctomycetes bacterium]|nr:FkbM family methyltransferase [Planctomycetota bacterium]
MNAAWGPRGAVSAFERIKKQQISVRQIIDVGAAKGQWTRECIEVWPGANYFLIEPRAENSDRLKQLGDEHRQVKYWIGGLGAMPGSMDLYVHDEQSSFFKSEFSATANRCQKKVEIRTLDSFLEAGEIVSPDLIKLDVQGYEIEVLKGAEKCLENAEFLLIEVLYREIYESGPLAHEVISWVGARGFRILDICSYTQRPLDGELAQSDMLFARENSQVFNQKGWSKNI